MHEQDFDKFGIKCECDNNKFKLILYPTPTTPPAVGRIMLLCLCCENTIEIDVRSGKVVPVNY